MAFYVYCQVASLGNILFLPNIPYTSNLPMLLRSHFKTFASQQIDSRSHWILHGNLRDYYCDITLTQIHAQNSFHFIRWKIKSGRGTLRGTL